MSDADSTDITHLRDESGCPPMRCDPDGGGWVPHGRCVLYHEDGWLMFEITYTHGVAHGPYRDCWPSGHTSLEGQHVNGLREGEWRFYGRENGDLQEVLRYVAGREVVDWDEFFRKSRSKR